MYMVKKKWLVTTLVMLFMFGLMAGAVGASPGPGANPGLGANPGQGQGPPDHAANNNGKGMGNGCAAAPAVAVELLSEAGIDHRYGEGPEGGNYISDVAREMGPRTDFDGVNKCDVDEYREAVAAFLAEQGAELDVVEVEEGEIWNKTQDKYYETIGNAVYGAEENDTILVGAGTYEENVTIDVQGLTLRGEDGAEIESQEADELEPSQPAVFIAEDNVTIENINLIEGISPGNSQDVVEIGDGVSGTHLLNLDVLSPDFTGEETGQGVIGQPQGAYIGDITISNVTTDRTIGLMVEDGTAVTITEVVVTKSGDDAQAIWISGTNWSADNLDLTIENVTPLQNEEGTGSDVDVMTHGVPEYINGEEVEDAEDAAEKIFGANPEVNKVDIDGTVSTRD